MILENYKAYLNENRETGPEVKIARLATYEELKNINVIKGKEDEISEKITNQYKIQNFVKIKDDQVRVVLVKKEHDIKRMQTEGTKKAKDPTPSALDPLPVFMLF